MAVFVNVFDESGSASKCVACGTIVRNGMEMVGHECPHEREQRLEAERQARKDQLAHLQWSDARQEAFDALVEACRCCDVSNGSCGTFADALEKLADEIEGQFHPSNTSCISLSWAIWLRAKAASIRAALARVDALKTTNPTG